jgi:hypothetical protein
MATSEAPSVADEPEPPRLALADAFYSGPLDGAWWPRSRDLQREAPILVDGFPSDRGRISRLLVSPPDWDRTGAHVNARRGQVNIGRFPGDDAHVIVLSLGGGTRLRLLVIDPGTHPGTAQALMREASAPGNRRDAGALLAAC